jgi:hypothetical protein
MGSPAASVKGKEKAKQSFKSKWITALGWLVFSYCIQQMVLVLKFQSVCAPVVK